MTLYTLFAGLVILVYAGAALAETAAAAVSDARIAFGFPDRRGTAGAHRVREIVERACACAARVGPRSLVRRAHRSI